MYCTCLPALRLTFVSLTAPIQLHAIITLFWARMRIAVLAVQRPTLPLYGFVVYSMG